MVDASSREDVSTQTTLGRSLGAHSLGGRYVQHSPPGGDTVLYAAHSAHCYVDDEGVRCTDVSFAYCIA